MKNNSKIMSNDVILHESSIISINTQIKMEKFYYRLKRIHEKLCSSYPDIKLVENIRIIYKNFNKEFKIISKSIKNFYEYKSVIDFISEVEPNETICWISNVNEELKLFMDSWISNVEDMLYNIFLYSISMNE